MRQDKSLENTCTKTTDEEKQNRNKDSVCRGCSPMALLLDRLWVCLNLTGHRTESRYSLQSCLGGTCSAALVRSARTGGSQGWRRGPDARGWQRGKQPKSKSHMCTQAEEGRRAILNANKKAGCHRYKERGKTANTNENRICTIVASL